MALVVEDGTGLTNADSYISVADADAYHLSVGNTSWAALSNDAKEIALRVATEYVDYAYEFVSRKKYIDQALQCPREWIDEYHQTWIYPELKKAVAELALKSTTEQLGADISSTTVKRERIDKIEVEYFRSSTMGRPIYTKVSGLLKPLIIGSRFNRRLLRVS